MKRISIGFFVISILITFSLENVMAQQKLTIAVLDFVNQSSYGGSKYGRKVSDWIIDSLIKSGKFIVVERNRLDAIMLEQDFQISGNVDPQTAISIGKMIGADAVLFGTINKLGISRKTIRVGDSKIKRYTAFTEVNVRAVDVQSGVIIFSDSDEASITTKSASVPGFDMGSKAPSVDIPLKRVIKELSEGFMRKLGNTEKGQREPTVL